MRCRTRLHPSSLVTPVRASSRPQGEVGFTRSSTTDSASWRSQPDVIYAAGGVAIRAVQQATKSIPIVGITGEMVGEGLVESFARPNGNTTGISILATELDGKRQDILIEAVPGIHRMAASPISAR
jgi:hypothetical protein